MYLRLGLVVLILCGALAFAPAPLPRQERPSQDREITLEKFQGSWRVAAWHVTQDKGEPRQDDSTVACTHVRIVRDRWTFMDGNKEGSTLYVSIDTTKNPAFLNFYQLNSRESVYGVGLIRRHHGRVQVMYRWGGAQGRPVTWESAPEGFWIVTLER